MLCRQPDPHNYDLRQYASTVPRLLSGNFSARLSALSDRPGGPRAIVGGGSDASGHPLIFGQILATFLAAMARTRRPLILDALQRLPASSARIEAALTSAFPVDHSQPVSLSTAVREPGADRAFHLSGLQATDPTVVAGTAPEAGRIGHQPIAVRSAPRTIKIAAESP